jgi:hypothetical protein
MHTLVDISKNGNLRNTFPFETPAGDVIEDKATGEQLQHHDTDVTDKG